MFTALHPIALVGTAFSRHFTSKRQEGRIRLPPDEDATHHGQTRIGREIQADWS
jgi:hypothetical protein